MDTRLPAYRTCNCTRGWLATPIILVVVALGVVVSSAAAADNDIRKAVELITQRTNAFRHDEGLADLASNAQLDQAAQQFAEYMANTGHYGHTVDGRQPADRARQAGYDYCALDENIGYQYRTEAIPAADVAKLLVEGWKNSPPHRHNLLDPNVLDIGVGVAQSRSTGWWYGVQMFGRSRSAQIVFDVFNAGPMPIQYQVAGRSYDLEPNATRTHKLCQDTKMTVQWPTAQQATATPANGEKYVAMKAPSGDWRLERQ